MLIVEDDDDSRDMLGELFEFEGANVCLAADAALAMAALAEFRPDVLVSDIGLPGENGHELMRRCRHLADEKLRRTPSIAVTAYTRAEDRNKALDSGFDDFQPKPLDLCELIAKVGRLASVHRP